MKAFHESITILGSKTFKRCSFCIILLIVKYFEDAEIRFPNPKAFKLSQGPWAPLDIIIEPEISSVVLENCISSIKVGNHFVD